MCGQEVLSSFAVVVYLFWAMLGLHCCAQASPGLVSGGYSQLQFTGFIVVASFVVEQGL